MLASVQIEHEVGQRPLQPRTQVPIHCEARAREFSCAFEIKYAEFLSQFPVRLGDEIEFRRCSPAPHLDVIFGRLADGHALVRQIGDAGENVLQTGLELFCCLLELLDLLPQFLRFRDLGGGVLAAFFQFRDLLRGTIALRLHGFGFGNGVAALGVHLVEIF